MTNIYKYTHIYAQCFTILDILKEEICITYSYVANPREYHANLNNVFTKGKLLYAIIYLIKLIS